MKYTRMQHRLGTTAIAAALALSATSLAAQEVPSTDTTVEAMTTTEPTTPVTDPLAPVADADATAPVAADDAVTTTVEATTDEAEAPAPAAKKSATTTARAAPRAAPKASAPAASSIQTPVATALAEAAPVAAMESAPEAAPVEQVAAQPSNQPDIDEALPLAGGAGAVILALAGAGMAVRRKRRHEEKVVHGDWAEEEELALTDEVEPVAGTAWEPPVHQPKALSMPASMETTEASDNFDTSKFGRHVQAAYAGPTPQNPSMSLRKRLKVAGELDRRERLSGTAPKSATPSQPMANMDKSAFSWGDAVSPAKEPEHQF